MNLNDKPITDSLGNQKPSIKISGINHRTRNAKKGAILTKHDDLLG